jgi:glutaredoxin-related protein
MTAERTTGYNSGFAKKRVQWLIEHSTSHQLLCYVDSFVLRNPLLRKAAKRYNQWLKRPHYETITK